MPFKSFILGKRNTGQTLAVVLATSFGLSRRDLEHYLKNRWVRVNGVLAQSLSQPMRAGQLVKIVVPNRKPSDRTPRPQTDPQLPTIARGIHMRYLDEHIVVVDKPAGLTTVRHADEKKELGARAQRYLPPTLVDLLPRLLPAGAKGRIRAVHRLDKETSGLIVLARTAAAESHLGKQFRAHTVERTYLALVRGQATEERIDSDLVADRGDGRRGSGTGGQHAVTHVRVVERLGDFTLVECRLETGRTHQVRIHLGERGTPLCGEQVYDRPLNGQPIRDTSGAKRPMLHAATLGLIHPATGKQMAWESEMPKDMRELRARFKNKSDRS